MKIMIVDDADFIRKMIVTYLHALGYDECIEASNGFEAIDKFKRCHPDVVFMDINMPEMDGFRAIEEIKSLNSDVIFIMCSVNGQISMIKNAIELGAADYIKKPFNRDRLQKAMETILYNH